MIATGIRWDESVKRSKRSSFEALAAKSKDRINTSIEELEGEERQIMLSNDNDNKRQFMERCKMMAKTVCNPIIDWTTSDVWDFINQREISTNPLYARGYERVGCIGCPMATRHQKERQFDEYPTYKRAYIRAFDKMIQKHDTNWKSGQEVFEWWMRYDELDREQLRLNWEDLK